MRNKRGLSNISSIDRKTLYIVLSIVMVLVLTLTVVYATLSTTLNINGNAEVSAASWDIYLDNVELNNGSVTTVVPTIIDKTTVTFSTALSKPGDYYMFTIDVVNNGSIDAMIEGITKTPELTETQKKYFNYIVEYQNGESITTKQLVEKKSFVRLKVKVEFRKDITASDLPTQSETLNLTFKVNYVQSDDSNENVTIDNDGKLIKVISGTGKQVGDEICIGEECFYVISSDEDSVTMLAKYNLYVGNTCTSTSSCVPYGNDATGMQNSTIVGWKTSGVPYNGVVEFSLSDYWSIDVNTFPSYVYDSNSSLYETIENYKIYLENKGVNIYEARLISVEELELLGCIRTNYNCNETPEWVYGTTYWTGSAVSGDTVLTVGSDAGFHSFIYSTNYYFGVRPVIKLLLSEF